MGFSGVLLGAFGAHFLRGLLEKSGTTQTWQTGVLYHLVHAVVLLVLSGWRPVPRIAYNLILVGVIDFQRLSVHLGADQFEMVWGDHTAGRPLDVRRLVGPGAGQTDELEGTAAKD